MSIMDILEHTDPLKTFERKGNFPEHVDPPSSITGFGLLSGINTTLFWKKIWCNGFS